MKKRFYFTALTAIIMLIAAIALLIVQSSLASQIKQGIKKWAAEYEVEISKFKCNVNLLAGNIGFKNLTLNQEGNKFKIKRGHITFNLSDFMSNKSIKGIYIDKAEVRLENFIPFSFPIMAKKSISIDEIKIKNLDLQIGASNGNNISDIQTSCSLKNIGTNKNTIFSINVSSNSSSMEINGNFDGNDWKERLTYEVSGKNISLGILNVLEESFLPTQIKEQLVSLYFKDVLMVKLEGKLNITGKGEINGQNIDSKLKFVVSELSSETENERIKSLIKKINTKGFLEINYKIYGTTSNPFLTYDILF